MREDQITAQTEEVHYSVNVLQYEAKKKTEIATICFFKWW